MTACIHGGAAFARHAGPRHGFFPVLPKVGDAHSRAAPYGHVSHRRRGDGSRDASRGHRGGCMPMREGFVGTGCRVPRRDRRTVSGSPVRLSPSGGFTACGPRMDVTAIGISPGVSGSIPSACGDRRTRVARPSRLGPPRSVADLRHRKARTAARGPRARPDPQCVPRPRAPAGTRAASNGRPGARNTKDAGRRNGPRVRSGP